MTSTGNDKHRALNYDGPGIPDRGKILNVKGWHISAASYAVLEDLFGTVGATKHCENLARKRDAAQ